MSDGYEVLEIPKGSWTEAIFVKEKSEEDTKPVVETPKSSSLDYDGEDDEDKDEDLPEDEDKQDDEDNDDAFDDDKLTEESYRTTYETTPDDLNYEAEEISDDSESDY